MTYADTRTNKPLAITPERQPDSWMQRHKEKLEVAKQGDIDILLIGDSITHFWEYREAPEIWDEYFSEYTHLNLGFGGDRTEHVIWRIQNGAIDEISPKLTVLLIGTNNTGHRKDPAKDTALGIQMILEELVTRLPQSKILLLAIFPRGQSPDDELRLINNETNEYISNFADNKRIFFLDINDNLINESGEINADIMPDFLHLSKKGYNIWATSMNPMISKLMGDMH